MSFSKKILSSIIAIGLIVSPQMGYASVLCGSDTRLFASFAYYGPEITLSHTDEVTTIMAIVENIIPDITFLSTTFVAEIVPRSDEVFNQDFFNHSVRQYYVATTVDQVRASESIDVPVTVDPRTLPVGAYELILHARYGEVDEMMPLVYPYTRIGSIPLTIIGAESTDVFAAVELQVPSTILIFNQDDLQTDNQVRATATISNQFQDQPLRADMYWRLYKGSYPSQDRLVSERSEEVRLLPGRTASYQFSSEQLVQDRYSAYTVTVTLVDQLTGQMLHTQRQLITDTANDQPLPITSALYYDGTSVSMCYTLLTDRKFLVDFALPTIELLQERSRIPLQTAQFSDSLHSNLSIPLSGHALPLRLESVIIDSYQSTTTIAGIYVPCLPGYGCSEGEVNVIGGWSDFNRYTSPYKFLLIAVAAAAVGFLLRIMLVRHERERRQYEASKKKIISK